MTKEERARKRLQLLLTLPGKRTHAEEVWILKLRMECNSPAGEYKTEP